MRVSEGQETDSIAGGLTKGGDVAGAEVEDGAVDGLKVLLGDLGGSVDEVHAGTQCCVDLARQISWVHKVQKVLEELLVRSHELFLGVLEGLCHELLDGDQDKGVILSLLSQTFLFLRVTILVVDLGKTIRATEVEVVDERLVSFHDRGSIVGLIPKRSQDIYALSKRVELSGESRDVDLGLEGLRELVKDDLVELEQLLRGIHVGLGKVAFDATKDQGHCRRTSRSDTLVVDKVDQVGHDVKCCVGKWVIAFDKFLDVAADHRASCRLFLQQGRVEPYFPVADGDRLPVLVVVESSVVNVENDDVDVLLDDLKELRKDIIEVRDEILLEDLAETCPRCFEERSLRIIARHEVALDVEQDLENLFSVLHENRLSNGDREHTEGLNGSAFDGSKLFVDRKDQDALEIIDKVLVPRGHGFADTISDRRDSSDGLFQDDLARVVLEDQGQVAHEVSQERRHDLCG
mmetsp:Transcript_48510/g.80641  ORF Transcript_48510/g.80641 Transcript_48510/m.80641 type:complete len:462 (+) Transcript_48510:515-1900(+)